MSSIQNLEIEVTELFKKKEYSKVIFQITSETKDEERTAFLYNLLGLSRITNNKKNIILNLYIPAMLPSYILDY